MYIVFKTPLNEGRRRKTICSRRRYYFKNEEITNGHITIRYNVELILYNYGKTLVLLSGNNIKYPLSF